MRRLLPALALLTTSCGKLDLVDVNAAFVLADAAWFAEEETLFVFWQVDAEQGLNPNSVIDITWETDEEVVPWQPIDEFDYVHPHVPADCGPNTFCGSASLHIPIEPRDVAIRLRYDRRSALDLTPQTVFNVVGPGPPHQSRSLTVYGVFNEDNDRIQWRARHTLPTVRNMQATELGLRRAFTIEDQRYGPFDPLEDFDAPPYGYGLPCPDTFVDAGLPRLSTEDRAIFDDAPLPLDAADDGAACATSTVFDATGSFTTDALARKNPEVRAGFPVLRSPVREATPLNFFLTECSRTISVEHQEMQRQRLFVEDADSVPDTCIDDWRSPGFVDRLEVLFREAVEEARPEGDDMVLVVGLHRDEPDLAALVEDALARVVPEERTRTSPHLAGAFVLDSTTRGLAEPVLSQTTLWCPSTLPAADDGTLPDASQRSCPTLPNVPGVRLGPLSAGVLPILPTRRQYLDFIDTYSVGTAGRATELTFLAPELSASADNVDLGEFGVVGFLNNEALFAEPQDAFSYCVQEDAPLVFVRSELMTDPAVQDAILQACGQDAVPPELAPLCEFAEFGLIPLQFLPQWHQLLGERRYALGLFWEFPFLLRMQYEASFAGAVTAFGLSVPFGVANPAEGFYGSQAWTAQAFSIDEVLAQCERYCDHPTFDSAGVYQVGAPFREAYAQACYRPRFPEPGDGGFPVDP